MKKDVKTITTKLHIPTEQFGYIEAEIEASPEATAWYYMVMKNAWEKEKNAIPKEEPPKTKDEVIKKALKEPKKSPF